VRPEGLAYPHWYPTQLSLPDDRVLLVGGYASEADPPVPAIEVWDGRVQRVTTISPEPFLLALGACAAALASGRTLFVGGGCPAAFVAVARCSPSLRVPFTTHMVGMEKVPAPAASFAIPAGC
jgi:hypothetical protein